MSRIHISADAQNDLDSIWTFSFNRWSSAQADEYYSALINKLKLALSDPNSGKRVDIRPELRQLLAGSHYIYYRPVADGIEVIRVLHQSMEVRRYL